MLSSPLWSQNCNFNFSYTTTCNGIASGYDVYYTITISTPGTYNITGSAFFQNLIVTTPYTFSVTVSDGESFLLNIESENQDCTETISAVTVCENCTTNYVVPEPAAINSTNLFIDRVDFVRNSIAPPLTSNLFTSTTGNNGGYISTNFTPVPSLALNSNTYDIRIYPGFTSQPTNDIAVKATVWFDYDENSVYSLDEVLFVGTNVYDGTNTSIPISGTLNFECGANPGLKLLRVAIADVTGLTSTAYIPPPTPMLNACTIEGEVEDYRVNYGCKGFKRSYLNDNTGLTLYNNNNSPEPLTVEYQALEDGYLSVELYATSGQLVKTLTDEFVEAKNTKLYQIDKEELNQGIYLLKVVHEGKSIFEKTEKITIF